MEFRLHLEGDHLKGEASGETPNGRMVGRIDATRVKNRGSTAPSLHGGLYKEISDMDGALYVAFNRRDLEAVKKLFVEDLEFYHDKEGLTGYQQNMTSFKKHFESPTLVRRELVDGTLEVYPLHGFGAVEIGVHRFYSTEPGQGEKLTATAKFVHVWQKTNGQWKISRVISYDHR
jgi:ketosteroid isomerase-like protein